MIKTYLRNWTLMRLFRLLLGIAAMIQAIIMSELALGLVAGLIIFMAVFNMGCCGTNGCGIKGSSSCNLNSKRD